MKFEMPKSRVFIVTDTQNRVVQIEGEYSLANISDLSKAILVEEGTPCDRLNHAQNHYLPESLYTEEGLYRYKYVDNQIVKRTDEELEADRKAIPAPPPSNFEILRADVDFLLMMEE